MNNQITLSETLKATDTVHNAIKTALLAVKKTHPNTAMVFAMDYHGKLEIIAEQLAKNILLCKTE